MISYGWSYDNRLTVSPPTTPVVTYDRFISVRIHIGMYRENTVVSVIYAYRISKKKTIRELLAETEFRCFYNNLLAIDWLTEK